MERLGYPGSYPLYLLFDFSNVKNFSFCKLGRWQKFYENQLITSLNSENFGPTPPHFKEDVIGITTTHLPFGHLLSKKILRQGNYNGLESPRQLAPYQSHFAFDLCHACFFHIHQIAAWLNQTAFATALLPLPDEGWICSLGDRTQRCFVRHVLFLAALLQYIRSKEKQVFLGHFSIYLFFILSFIFQNPGCCFTIGNDCCRFFNGW